MFSSMLFYVSLGAISLALFVYSLYRHEERIETMERQIAVNQEKFTNK